MNKISFKRILATLLILAIVFTNSKLTCLASDDVNTNNGDEYIISDNEICEYDSVISSNISENIINTSTNNDNYSIYTNENYNVIFEVENSWEDGFTAKIRIENTGLSDIINWKLEFDSDNNIQTIWNASIENVIDNKYILKNNGYNSTIKKGEFIEFGLEFEGSFSSFPEKYILCSSNIENKYNLVDIVYSLESDWGDGFSASITIKNNGNKTIEDWSLFFNFDRKIDYIWNAEMINHIESGYTITNTEYNRSLPPNSEIIIGFNGCEGDANELPTDFEFKYGESSIVSVSSNIVTDDSQIIDEDYYISLSDGDIERNYIEKAINNELALRGISVSEIMLSDDYDSDGLSLIQEYEYDTNPFEKDSDNDGLDDYNEINFYYTNPLMKDTDADGISDGTEIEVNFNPLCIDSNNDGITDNNEITTQDIDLLLNYNVIETDVFPNVKITGKGDYRGKLYAIPLLEDKTISSLDCIVGTPFEFQHDDYLEFENAELSFILSGSLADEYSLDDLAIAYYDRDNNRLELENSEYDYSNNTISAEISHFSTYFLVSKNIYLDNMNVDILNGEGVPSDLIFFIDYSTLSKEELNNIYNNLSNIYNDLSSDIDFTYKVICFDSSKPFDYNSIFEFDWNNSLDFNDINNITELYSGSLYDIDFNSIDNIQHSDMFYYNGNSYMAINNSGSWNESKELCESMGGHLVTITSIEEQSFIESQILENQILNRYYIGAFSESYPYNYKWVTGEPFIYTNWVSGEPNSRNEFYIELYSENSLNHGKWNNIYDTTSVKKSCICEWEGNRHNYTADYLNYVKLSDFREDSQKNVFLITNRDNSDVFEGTQLFNSYEEDDISFSLVSKVDNYSYEHFINSRSGIKANIYEDFSNDIKNKVLSNSICDGRYNIRLSNGCIVTLDKNPLLMDASVDTDGDGLCDLLELGHLIDIPVLDNTTNEIKWVKAWTFYSNPTVVDTDGDSIDDVYDLKPSYYDAVVIEQNDANIIFNSGRVWHILQYNAYDYIYTLNYSVNSNGTQPDGLEEMLYYSNENINQEFSIDELVYIGVMNNEGSKVYLNDYPSEILDDIFFRTVGRKPDYYKHCFSLSNDKWEKVDKNTEGGYWKGKVLSESDFNYTYKVNTVTDCYDDLNSFIESGGVLIVVVVGAFVVTSSPEVAPLVYLASNAGVASTETILTIEGLTFISAISLGSLVTLNDLNETIKEAKLSFDSSIILSSSIVEGAVFSAIEGEDKFKTYINTINTVDMVYLEAIQKKSDEILETLLELDCLSSNSKRSLTSVIVVGYNYSSKEYGVGIKLSGKQSLLLPLRDLIIKEFNALSPEVNIDFAFGSDCAEDACVNSLGGKKYCINEDIILFQAFRPRTMQIVKVCDKCQGYYGRTIYEGGMFAPYVLFASP